MIRLALSIILCMFGLGIMSTTDHPYVGMIVVLFGAIFYGWYLSSLEDTFNRKYLRV